MTKDELLKDLWNSYSKSCDTPYRQWIKQGFYWMYGWHESELKAKLLDKDIHREARERTFKRSNIALEKEKAELKAKLDIAIEALESVYFNTKEENKANVETRINIIGIDSETALKKIKDEE